MKAVNNPSKYYSGLVCRYNFNDSLSMLAVISFYCLKSQYVTFYLLLTINLLLWLSFSQEKVETRWHLNFSVLFVTFGVGFKSFYCHFCNGGTVTNYTMPYPGKRMSILSYLGFNAAPRKNQFYQLFGLAVQLTADTFLQTTRHSTILDPCQGPVFIQRFPIYKRNTMMFLIPH